jgi:hypothetical protein
LSIDEAVKAIEERIEKRSAQLKKIEKWIEAWGADDDADDAAQTTFPRSDWLKAAIENNEEAARSANKDEEKIRLTKVACVHLSKEMVDEDFRMSRVDAQKLVKEFSGQVASLKEFLNNVLRSPLADGLKHLRSKQATSSQ